jgi:FdhD protein
MTDREPSGRRPPALAIDLAPSGRGVTRRLVTRFDGATSVAAPDDIAVEEPLEIRLGGDTLAVTMRTPGDDADLVLGFLFAEGVIRSIDDVGGVVHCGRVGEPEYGNVVDVTPAPGVALDPERSRRGTLTTSACGVCGRQRIDDLLERVGVLSDDVVVPLALIAASPGLLVPRQPNFERSGGLHAAGLVALDGSVLASAEDVGRHNAVDKVLGQILRRPPPSPPVLLVVSGRVSFEIVQKAAVAGVPVVAAVSAPTSLAVDLATRARMAVAGFVRGDRVNLYAHVVRVVSS